MKRNGTKGITLVELMITLVIAAALLSLGLMTLRGYVPKQQLLASVQQIENALQRAQSEAGARSYWTCVKFKSGTTFEIWVDSGGAYHDASAGSPCGDSGDQQIGPTLQLKGRTALAAQTSAGCLKNVSSTCAIWFDPTGIPQSCKTASGCGITPPTSGCAAADFQIIVSNPDLASGTRAREVEATSGGLVQTIKLGSPISAGKGSVTTLFAKIPPNQNDAAACE